ncbi:hypothetical protein CPB83DRAFT_541741 [Crepidotus variabilis]|uniref:Uncharacterized protein n=1 Tax=Crepidotus variabilis TaxID=179855 RepID=A0A9P6JUC3_9AGAR|nr:hypothetical protein CPB83DRAFT_541741 [Crepidotus variabilis]
MPSLFSRRKSESSTSKSMMGRNEFSVSSLSTLEVAQMIDRKIIQRSSSGSYTQSRRVSDLIGTDPFESEGIDVMGLQTNAKSWATKREALGFEAGIKVSARTSQSLDFSISNAQEDQNSQCEKDDDDESFPKDTPVLTAGESLLVQQTRTPPSPQEKPKTLTRWPTFGSNPLRQEHSKPGTNTNDNPSYKNLHCESAYSLNNSAISQSYFTAENYSQTPASHSHSFHTSTPFSTSDNSTHTPVDIEQLSPNIFGMRTPPRSNSFPDATRGSRFNFTEVPPPLPPLDHPAFRENLNEFGVFRPKGVPFPSRDSDKNKIARHSSSLPTIANPRNVTRSETFFSSIARHTRTRARSSAAATYSSVQRAKAPPLEATKRIFHSRSRSKGSINSSRRSSAEYSAQQAASIGSQGCWEVDVSKAIIGLAFGEGQGVEVKTSASTPAMTARSAEGPSIQSKARGYNVGSAFLKLSADVLTPSSFPISPFCFVSRSFRGRHQERG